MESGDAGSTPAEPREGLREQAVERIKRKQKFLYLLVNTGLWAFWAYEGADTNDLSPALVSGIWGVLLTHDAFRAYWEVPSPSSRSRKKYAASSQDKPDLRNSVGVILDRVVAPAPQSRAAGLARPAGHA